MNDSLLKRTLVVTLAMVGATALWVGGVSFIAVSLADRVGGGASPTSGSANAANWSESAASAHAKAPLPPKPNG